MEGITISAAGVPRASVEESRAIHLLSPVCAARARWLTPTTAHGYRGFFLVGWYMGCVNRHLTLAGGLCVRSINNTHRIVLIRYVQWVELKESI